jgi:hypothetical protein
MTVFTLIKFNAFSGLYFVVMSGPKPRVLNCSELVLELRTTVF